MAQMILNYLNLLVHELKLRYGTNLTINNLTRVNYKQATFCKNVQFLYNFDIYIHTCTYKIWHHNISDKYQFRKY